MSEAASRQVSPALEKAYQFLAWLIPTLDKFPRRQKFLLGDRIESTALDVLEGLVEATYTRNRGRLLEAVNLKLDKLRPVWPRHLDAGAGVSTEKPGVQGCVQDRP
jgi:hypothetical protein